MTRTAITIGERILHETKQSWIHDRRRKAAIRDPEFFNKVKTIVDKAEYLMAMGDTQSARDGMYELISARDMIDSALDSAYE